MVAERERGQVSTLFNSGLSAGTAIGAPLVVAWLIGSSDWRWSFVILGGAGALAALAWWGWFGKPEEVRWLRTVEREHILRWRDPRRGSSRSDDADALSASPQRIRDLLRLPTWGLMLTQGGMVYTGYLFFTWPPSYLQSTLKLSLVDTGIYTAVPFATAIVVGLLRARLCDRMLAPATVALGRRRYFIAAFMLLGLSILLVPACAGRWLALGNHGLRSCKGWACFADDP